MKEKKSYLSFKKESDSDFLKKLQKSDFEALNAHYVKHNKISKCYNKWIKLIKEFYKVLNYFI